MNRISKILWATLLIILGIVVGLNSFNIININIFFNGFWTFFIIIPCIIDLFNKKRIKFDIIGIIVGFFLLLICLNIINLSLIIKLLIPLTLILLGLFIKIAYRDIVFIGCMEDGSVILLFHILEHSGNI